MATILVVDDSELIRMLLKEFLEAEGHQVVEAADGGQGVAMAASRTVDMAFVDIFMAG
ncbi:MAG: response regulator, partial [Desulfovibrio sp.]|nr:response regulator [Desulfovibrio sp.]